MLLLYNLLKKIKKEKEEIKPINTDTNFIKIDVRPN